MVTIHKVQNYRQRELKASGGKFIPSSWLFVDTETRELKKDGVTSHFFKIGWTCLWVRGKRGGHGTETWRYFTKANAFNRYINETVQDQGGLILMGHNIFFDLQASGFFRYFTRQGWRLKFYYDQGLTYILKCRLKGVVLTVISSTNWFDQSLKKLGEHLGLEKLEVDFDKATPEELKTYCRRDVEIVVRALQEYISFIRKHDLGKFCLTKASQAFTAYRHRFMSHKILIHSEDYIHELERAAYIGGRCECFHIGQVPRGPFETLDVNAMYPFVMSTLKYPWKLINYYENPEPGRIWEMLKVYAVIAEVELDTDVPAYAVRYKTKTIYPVGRFTAFLCSRGLEYAFSHRHVKAVRRASVYRQGDLFGGYVDYLKALRDKYKAEDNAIFLLLCKYMHNSLYGKFAQREMHTDSEDLEEVDLYTREDVPNLVTGRTVVVTTLMSTRITQYPEGEGEMSNVAIAAHITENARFVLWEIMNQVGLDRVLYCDTDSVKIRASDRDRVTWPVDPAMLGALKVENTSEKLYIQGPKNYRTEDLRKIKGIPKSAVEVEPGVFTFTSFVRQVSHMRTGQVVGARVEQVTRRLVSPYRKGVVLKNGRVRPFRFPSETPPF